MCGLNGIGEMGENRSCIYSLPVVFVILRLIWERLFLVEAAHQQGNKYIVGGSSTRTGRKASVEKKRN